MSKKYTAKNIKLDELVLDKENPRFAELYNGSDKEEEIIDYLLWTESASEIAEAITTANEYYDDRPLWVYKDNGKYIVKDGNRRCSAVKALQQPNYYKLNHPKLEIKEKRLKSLKGMVPSILEMGEGCKLCSRFDPKDCACKGTKEEPDLIEVSNSHWARVHPGILS